MALFGGRSGQQGGASVGSTVYIMGLDQLTRDLRAMDREFGTTGRTELQREIQKAATLVADHAKTVTIPQAGMLGNERRRRDSRTGQLYGKPRKGYRPGGTQKRTRGYVRAGTGIVTVRSGGGRYNAGFRYPWMYEFGTSQRNTDPHRPFLYPALNEKRDEIMETLAEGIERVARKHGFRGGGIA